MVNFKKEFYYFINQSINISFVCSSSLVEERGGFAFGSPILKLKLLCEKTLYLIIFGLRTSVSCPSSHGILFLGI